MKIIFSQLYSIHSFYGVVFKTVLTFVVSDKRIDTRQVNGQ
ncbi:MAG: hypothetical protein DF168_00443 [Candidatus Moanabacter tarae]|uniref:Uncharacterized protein n=1 Tax=Candidatus Moanibacter tarae TaxID=2200854 RepID=A0A2Z4ANV2_9BACT|nr:MAG: hypothetical protein DF168_00443 [Candidatus Moanabacter tarae]